MSNKFHLKVFQPYFSNKPEALEEEVNTWLDTHPRIRIIQMTQTEPTPGQSWITLSLLYESLTTD